MKLLAILVGAESAPACLDAAVLAARSLQGASVEALHVMVDPDQVVSSSEEVAFQRLREIDEGTAQQRADATHTAFVAWNSGVEDDTPAVRWKAVTGAEEQVVTQEAAQADVIVLVLARQTNMDSGDALHAAIFRSGKPLLIVPQDWRGRSRTRFSHIAVGLSDSEATRHAIDGAGPWLRAADRVTAIRIGRKGDAATTLTRLLSEVGADPELRVVAQTRSDLGKQIVHEAEAVGADLLVTGAYRHSEMVDWLVGGTTRHLLAATSMPLLFAH